MGEIVGIVDWDHDPGRFGEGEKKMSEEGIEVGLGRGGTSVRTRRKIEK